MKRALAVYPLCACSFLSCSRCATLRPVTAGSQTLTQKSNRVRRPFNGSASGTAQGPAPCAHPRRSLNPRPRLAPTCGHQPPQALWACRQGQGVGQLHRSSCISHILSLGKRLLNANGTSTSPAVQILALNGNQLSGPLPTWSTFDDLNVIVRPGNDGLCGSVSCAGAGRRRR